MHKSDREKPAPPEKNDNAKSKQLTGGALSLLDLIKPMAAPEIGLMLQCAAVSIALTQSDPFVLGKVDGDRLPDPIANAKWEAMGQQRALMDSYVIPSWQQCVQIVWSDIGLNKTFNAPVHVSVYVCASAKLNFTSAQRLQTSVGMKGKVLIHFSTRFEFLKKGATLSLLIRL